MKYLLSLIALLAMTFGVLAQGATFQCQNNGAACAPGSPNCQCVQVIQEPQAVAPPVVVQQAPPACPWGTYYQGGVCMQIAPTYVPQPPVIYENPWGNVPFNQQPGWPHPGGFGGGGVTQVPGGWVGPGGHFHPR